MSIRIAVLLTAAALLSAPAVSFAQENEDCMGCHAEGLMGARKVDFKAFGKSIHGRHLCISCHTDAPNLPHQKLKPVSCNTCHRLETRIYMTSDHGQAVGKGQSEAAACKDCHGHSHTLLNSRDPKSPVNRHNIPATCARCHNDQKRMGKFHLSEKDPTGSYSHTIHGEAFKAGKMNAATCTDCHGSHDLHGAANSQSRIFWRNVPETCGRCHANVGSVYAMSIHGRATAAGIKESPVCTSCHGEHTIRGATDPGSSSYLGAVTKTCVRCHASEPLARKFGLPLDREKTYLDTYHGLAYQRGALNVANCASCHGFHDILPHTDPLSSIHQDNLAKTCGKCHQGAGKQLARGFVHAPVQDRHWSLGLAYYFYLFLIPMVIGGMLIHNGLDFLRKLLRSGLPVVHEHPDELRMSVNERCQHAANALTFIVLAYTGFVLKFPEAWWALPMSFADENFRRLAHRWAAVVFCVVGVYHALYMLGTARGRSILWGLLPRWRDAVEPLQLMAYNAGLRRAHPKLSTPYNYIEKSEYWALIWGSIVMVVSGAVLAFSAFTLKHFPMWVPELATLVHFYEAILACLAILVWHMYWVIFDPAVYPMNFAWLTGHIRRHHKK